MPEEWSNDDHFNERQSKNRVNNSTEPKGNYYFRGLFQSNASCLWHIMSNFLCRCIGLTSV